MDNNLIKELTNDIIEDLLTIHDKHKYDKIYATLQDYLDEYKNSHSNILNDLIKNIFDTILSLKIVNKQNNIDKLRNFFQERYTVVLV